MHRPDRSSSSSSLEDGVLDRLQPDVDPRLVELVNELPPEDRKIALLKIAADCSWAAAAANYGQTDRRAETIRRRLDRHRQALNPNTEPWPQHRDAVTPHGRDTVGRVRPSAVIIDGITGVWP